MIEDTVVELFKAALTELMEDPFRKVSAFQINAVSRAGKEAITMFLIRDQEVVEILLKNFDEMSKDHGGRKAVEIRIKIDDPTQETPGSCN